MSYVLCPAQGRVPIPDPGMPEIWRDCHEIGTHGQVEVWVAQRNRFTELKFSATGDRNDDAWTANLRDLAGRTPTPCEHCAFPLLTGLLCCQRCEALESELETAVRGSSFFSGAPDVLADIAWSLWSTAGAHDQPRSVAEFARAYEWMLDSLPRDPGGVLQLIDQTAVWPLVDQEVRDVAA